MGLFQAFNISASGMTAERFRTDIIAQNIANVNTTSTKEGTPYRRKIVTFSEKNVTPFSQIYSSSKKAAVGNGVKVSSVTSDYSTDFIKEYDPSNPDADADGYVSYPNVNTVTEMTNLIDATRAYEANATALDSAKRAEKPSVAVQKPAEPKSGTMQQDTKPDMKQMTGIDISGITKTQPASAAPASKAGATAATGTAASVSVKASDAAFGTPAGSSANADVINHTHEILKLYKSGKSNVEIAKLLSLGTGEVKLIIDLYKEGK